MSFATRVRDVAARILVRIAKRRGKQIDFVPESGVSVDELWGFAYGFEGRFWDQGGETDLRRIQITIPRQAGFPTSNGLRIGDAFKVPTSTGETYIIEEVRLSNGVDWDDAAAFELDCARLGQQNIGHD